ncbi:MAG: TraB/GumN family protein [Rhizobacter sp.]|nr:TraB/GumN family protein [Rhizobacter sp.]
MRAGPRIAPPRGCALALLLAIVPALLFTPPAARAAAPADCPPAAQAPSVDQHAAAGREARDRGFLWRIERAGRSSYLYGTIHVAQAEWMLPGPKVSAAIAASDSVALEIDLLDADIARRLAAGMRALPDERPPAALESRLQALIVAECLPLDALSAISPSMQLATLTTLAARRDGLDPAFAIDGVLAVLARVLGKPVISLETPEMQIALLRGDPRTADERLTSGLADLEQGKVRPMLLRMARAWDEGRADELEHYEAWCECVDTEADRAELVRMLDDRNPALADRIAALHDGGTRVFAAVGALHLFGAHGLPSLLARRGFTVERVEFVR